MKAGILQRGNQTVLWSNEKGQRTNTHSQNTTQKTKLSKTKMNSGAPDG